MHKADSVCCAVCIPAQGSPLTPQGTRQRGCRDVGSVGAVGADWRADAAPPRPAREVFFSERDPGVAQVSRVPVAGLTPMWRWISRLDLPGRGPGVGLQARRMHYVLRSDGTGRALCVPGAG